LLSGNNQYEDGIVAAVRYFAADTQNQLKNFSNLVDGLLAKPNSVKILKQHVLMAATLGFENEAQDSLNKLRKLVPDASFKKFIAAAKSSRPEAQYRHLQTRPAEVFVVHV